MKPYFYSLETIVRMHYLGDPIDEEWISPFLELLADENNT